MPKRKSMITVRKKNIKPKCSACNGSGVYDHDNTPKCASCGGTGLSTYYQETKD